jgi:hypothetical protein
MTAQVPAERLTESCTGRSRSSGPSVNWKRLGVYDHEGRVPDFHQSAAVDRARRVKGGQAGRWEGIMTGVGGLSRVLSLQQLTMLAILLGGAAIGRSEGAVTVSFSLAQSAVTLHEPVFVDFAVENGLPEGIRLDLGLDRKGKFEFTVVRPDGSRFRLPALERGSWAAPPEVRVPAGGSYKQTLLLNEWYQFARPGEYGIEARLAGSIQTQSGHAVQAIAAQQLTLRIEPRSPERLAAVCQRLADTAVHESDVQTAVDAAFGLAYVEDLAAVPYLGKVAEEAPQPPVRQIAVEGLARIANADGIEQVVSRLNPRDADLDSAVKAALRGIQAGAKIMD